MTYYPGTDETALAIMGAGDCHILVVVVLTVTAADCLGM